MYQLLRITAVTLAALIASGAVWAGKLAIVIDDFGYRPQTENQVIALPAPVSVAVLPNAPHASEMAIKAHNQGHEVLLHLPMAPISKQPLEKDTLRPEMSSTEIDRIIRDAIDKVPYAVGINNHMGSAMTSSLSGMQKVMQALESYRLYFLDSVTIGSTQASRAAAGTGVKVIKRNVFLDDTQNESDIRYQLNRAIALARRNGSAIAIGHPHPATVKVLQQMIPALPADITLVRPSDLLDGAQSDVPQPSTTIATRHNKAQAGKVIRVSYLPGSLCKPAQSIAAIPDGQFFIILSDSISQSTLVQYFRHQWQGWRSPP